MENKDLNFDTYIIKALDLYDDRRGIYNNYIRDNDSINKFKNDDIEILGYYDNENKIWIWGWILPNKISNLCYKLLDYGLNIDPTNESSYHHFIKSLLLNSRLIVNNLIELDINLAICSYILKDLIKFILPYKFYLNDNKDKYITYYYLVKNI